MRAAQLCIAFVVAGCLLGGSSLPEPGLDAENLLQLGSGAEPPPDVNQMKEMFNAKMKAVGELHEEAVEAKEHTTNERQEKAMQAAEYMNSYRAKKEVLVKKQDKMSVDIAADEALVLRTAKGDERTAELRKKHDTRIRHTMRAALHAMYKVEKVTGAKVSTDPTVIDAARKTMLERSNEVYSVLALTPEQMNRNWLLKMDEAVAAYNENPDSHHEEKLEKALEVTKERVGKEKIIEMKAKKEIAAKHKRTEDNKAYYDQKWHEKKKEMGRKKSARDDYVKKLQTENKFKKWVQEQNENEGGHKAAIFEKEKSTKVKAEKAHKTQREKVYAANAKIIEEAKKKFDFEQQQLQLKVDAAKGEYTTKKNEVITAKEVRDKTRQSMHTIRANEERSVDLEAAAKTKADAANEMKTKFASETNDAAAKKEDELLKAAQTSTSEAQFKYKAILATMDEKDKVQTEKVNAEAAALKLKLEAEKEAADHKATKAEVLEKAATPPGAIPDTAPKELTVENVMREQLAARDAMLPPPTQANYPIPKVSQASKDVQAGAAVPDPAGNKAPLEAPAQGEERQ
jgi:hypothetical protein